MGKEYLFGMRFAVAPLFFSKLDGVAKSGNSVILANARIQKVLKILDPGFRRDDARSDCKTFYEVIKI